jgi:hypothetical protein
MTTYNKIFKPETMDLLNGKSKESLKKYWGNKTLQQAVQSNFKLLNEIVEVEKDYRRDLEKIAIQICQDMYPVLKDNNIKIKARITGFDKPETEEDEIEIDEPTEEDENFKRRVINGITQGASVRGPYLILLFKDYLDIVDPELLDKYKEVLDLTFGVFDDETAIAMMLAMLAQGQKQEGGTVKVEYVKEDDSDEDGTLMIKATGVCFAYLVHEIVKGLYETLSLHGFSRDPEQNKHIVQTTDKLSAEPRDTQYGKFIYDAISDIYNNSSYDDSRIKEYLFVEIYKMEDDEFLNFIENLLHDKLTTQQKRWVNIILKEISDDLKVDDMPSNIT